MNDETNQTIMAAEREVMRSRARLMTTLAEIRDRMDPRIIATDTASNVLNRANQLVDKTTTSISERPALALGGMAAALAVFGLKRWLARSKED